MKYNELLKQGEEYLRSAKIADASYDARLLFEDVTGMGRGELVMRGDSEEASEREEELFRLRLEKRAAHIPVQYITGKADFMGLEFYVNRDVLIPRFDTEFLVEEMMREVDDGTEVLDMCTGSGCILLSLMNYKNDIRGTGADISQAALMVARENEKRIYGTQDAPGLHNAHIPVSWICSDMFENIEGRFDHIVCNPPYIKSDVIPTLMEEVKDHEPLGALDGDEDGLEFYRILAREAGNYLKKYGRLYMEIGYDQGKPVKELLSDNGYEDIEVLKDYGGNDRVVKARHVRQ